MARFFSTYLFVTAVSQLLVIAIFRILALRVLFTLWFFAPASRPLCTLAPFRENDALMLSVLKRPVPKMTRDPAMYPSLVAENEELAAPVAWEELTAGNVGVVRRAKLSLKKKKKNDNNNNNDGSDETREVSVIVKCSSLSVASQFILAMLDLTVREHDAFTLLPTALSGRGASHPFAPQQPAVYFSDFTAWPVPMLLVMMEDYGRMRHESSRVGCGFDDAAIMMRAMAQMHAPTFGAAKIPPSFMDHFRWPACARIIDYSAPVLKAQLLSGPFVQLLETECTTVRRAMSWFLDDFAAFDGVKKLITGFGAIESMKPGLEQMPPRVCVCHGDFRLDNAFIDDATQTAHAVDWQVPSVRHPVADICFFLCEIKSEVACDEAQLNKLLGVYSHELWKHSSGEAVYDVEDIRADMRSIGLLNTAYYYVVTSMASRSQEGKDKQMFDITSCFFRRIEQLLRTYGYDEDVVESKKQR